MSSDPKHTITNQYILMNIISEDKCTQAHNISNIYILYYKTNK